MFQNIPDLPQIEMEPEEGSIMLSSAAVADIDIHKKQDQSSLVTARTLAQQSGLETVHIQSVVPRSIIQQAGLETLHTLQLQAGSSRTLAQSGLDTTMLHNIMQNPQQQLFQNPQQVLQNPQQLIQNSQQVLQSPQHVIQNPQQLMQNPQTSTSASLHSLSRVFPIISDGSATFNCMIRDSTSKQPVVLLPLEDDNTTDLLSSYTLWTLQPVNQQPPAVITQPNISLGGPSTSLCS